MKLDEVLGGASDPVDLKDQVWKIDGTIERHHDTDVFRLYPNAFQRDQYYLIRNEDVVGDVYLWSKDELYSNGIVGQDRHRIFIKLASLISIVRIQTLRAGVPPRVTSRSKKTPSNSRQRDTNVSGTVSPCNCNCAEGKSCSVDQNGSCRCNPY